MSKKSLGLISMGERTIEHDIALLERFQEFSAELLRLSLLGISAIGFAASKVVFPDKDAKPFIIVPRLEFFLAVTLIAFGVSAAAALLHRYVSADSLSWHLQAMRRYERAGAGDEAIADAEAARRYRRFKTSERSLAVAAISLGMGAVSLAGVVWLAL